MLLALNYHCLLVCCLCHSCKSHIKRNLELRTTHRKPIELKKACVKSWAKFLQTHCHHRSLLPMQRFAFPHWIQHLELRACEIGHLLTFLQKSDALPACFWNSLHVSELCAPWCCCSGLSVIVPGHFILLWLRFVDCQSTLGISARWLSSGLRCSCFSFCPFHECRQKQPYITLKNGPVA